MWDSPSVVAGGEGHSPPVPNDRRGRHPHHSGAGLLRPVIPATCATVSLDTTMMVPKKVYRIASQTAATTLPVSHRVGFLPGLLASCFRPVGSPRSLRPGAPPRKMLIGFRHRNAYGGSVLVRLAVNVVRATAVRNQSVVVEAVLDVVDDGPGEESRRTAEPGADSGPDRSRLCPRCCSDLCARLRGGTGVRPIRVRPRTTRTRVTSEHGVVTVHTHLYPRTRAVPSSDGVTNTRAGTARVHRRTVGRIYLSL